LLLCFGLCLFFSISMRLFFIRVPIYSLFI
jgi:hypothetical protein